MSVLSKVSRREGKKVRRLAELVPLVNALEPEMEARSDASSSLTPVFRERLADARASRPVVEAFALVRRRLAVLGQRHFDAQLMAGWPALRLDRRDEDREGKTLVSTLPCT